MKRCRHLSAFIWCIFHLFVFSGSHWYKEKLNTWFFHPQIRLWLKVSILRDVWYMFYVRSKQSFMFSSPFSINSALTNCEYDANTLSDRWRTSFWSIWHHHSWSQLWQNHVLTAHSKSVMRSEFFQTLGIHSTRFLRGNCPLWFLFLINMTS